MPTKRQRDRDLDNMTREGIRAAQSASRRGSGPLSPYESQGDASQDLPERLSRRAAGGQGEGRDWWVRRATNNTYYVGFGHHAYITVKNLEGERTHGNKGVANAICDFLNARERGELGALIR